MLESVKDALRQQEGRAFLNVKLYSDQEEWRLQVVAADEIGLVIEHSNGTRECYPWKAIEAVILPQSQGDPLASGNKAADFTAAGLGIITAALLEAEAVANIPFMLGMGGVLN